MLRRLVLYASSYLRTISVLHVVLMHEGFGFDCATAEGSVYGVVDSRYMCRLFILRNYRKVGLQCLVVGLIVFSKFLSFFCLC